MLSTEAGLDCFPDFLYQLLRTQHRFNDPEGESVYANSQSRSTWQTHISSRAASPSLPDGELSGPPSAKSPQKTMTAYSPSGPRELPSLCTPRTHAGRRIRCESLARRNEMLTEARTDCIYEWDKLIDSSDVNVDAFLAMAADVERNYRAYDGFVILHGTDTMAYSSSILSFLLENLG
jgi:lysophospholipase